MATHSSVLAWRIPGTGSLMGCHLWGHTESDTTEVMQQQQQQQQQTPMSSTVSWSLLKFMFKESVMLFYHLILCHALLQGIFPTQGLNPGLSRCRPILNYLSYQGSPRFCMLLLLLSCFSHVRLCATPETAAHQAPRTWDSPGKNTGVGCHFLLW